ncbi:MAG: inorganic phosphate transporter [Dehalococcoidia bacterium]|nr:inorganic phosphate transporter [Dehalococcoidia bacterium]
MFEMSFLFLVLVITVAVIFDFVNGFHDSANAIATVVSTRVLTILTAVIMAGVLNFVGALSGTAVAKVVGAGIVAPGAITMTTVAAGLMAAIVWEILTYFLKLPVSASHSLIAGVAGAGVATAGFKVLVWTGISKTLLGVILSPLVGFIIGYVVMLALYWLLRRASQSMVNHTFGRLQIVSAAAMAYSHGSNDAQKTMGIITLALSVHYSWAARGIPFEVPFWVIVLSGIAIALGTYAGGYRMIKTLGVRIVQMQPINGFAAESSAAVVIETASRFGFPLSTTHVISSTIMGQGATRRVSAVRWGVVRSIVLAWVITFPFCGLLGALIYRLLKLALSAF